MAKKEKEKRKADDGKEKGKKAPVKKKKETREELIEKIRNHKEEIQSVRFGVSKKEMQKGGSSKQLRREVARAATKLTAMRKEAAKARESGDVA